MALWEQCQRLGLSVTGESPVFMCFSQFIPFIEKYSDISKSKKLSSNAFFSLFHPLDDYNLQNIFHILPALTSVMEDEWILLSSFQSHSRGFWSSSAPVPLDCTNQRILDSFQDVLRQQFTTNNDKESFTGQILQYESHQDGSDNVQKKAIPWNSPSAAVLQELFPFPFLSSINKDCQHAVNPNRNGMILIASLIHKQANLGGLCRTCEIFGVSEVVLGGISVLEEREFKSLSVTAEKWLKITQVKPGQLKEYLMELKKLNYNLIGLEQTAHSTNVTNYKFKSRTALLLGNEREGIPVDLIHLLDECVVIPQYGVIRSLNVHVSGAIAMWEYIKQYLDH
jgi:tRNA G18 (ribose-2'-O)-methylase SpoU